MSIFYKNNNLSSSHYSLPIYAGDLCQLGQIFNSVYAVECSEIIERYSGPIMLIVPDMNNVIRLYKEIKQFTNYTVNILPDWEIFPYDYSSPNKNIISTRLLNLYNLPNMINGIIILSVHTLIQRVCPYNFLYSYSFKIKKDQNLSYYELLNQLKKSGYQSSSPVTMHGEFFMHRTLCDLYPMGHKKPYRIYLDNEKVHSIYNFNVNTQRTLNEVDWINILPAYEFPTDEISIKLFRKQWRMQFEVGRDPQNIYQKVSKNILPNGIEYWQSLFFKKLMPSLFTYIPLNTLIIHTSNLEDISIKFLKKINQIYQTRYMNSIRPLVHPKKIWLCIDILLNQLKKWPRIILENKTLPIKKGNINLDYHFLPDLKIQIKNKLPLNKLNDFILNFNGIVIFSVKNKERYKILQNLLNQININILLITRLNQANIKNYSIMIGAFECGFLDKIRNRVLICENDIFGNKYNCYKIKNYKNINQNTLINNLTRLSPGQLIVHIEHGIGRYIGLTILEIHGIKGEYLILSYAGDDKLYLPVSSLHLIHRYIGNSNENVVLHKLGGDTWIRTKQKSVMHIRDVAVELLEIYAMRASKIGFSFKYNHEKYQIFCQSFPFDTTLDQQKAIDAVLNDMCKPLAMDRLICGDVGFGKTEIAMRAAFLAVENNKQTAVLVPTTLLAQQHLDNFRNRFSSWPIKIEMISRFKNIKEKKQILNAISIGKIDIIIGTHKLLQNNLSWKDLGLLIIDEEHRFGVRQKELIKKKYTNIDILTLTATPLPRTLNMAISGIRDLSIISTPPSCRLKVKTFVCKYNKIMIREIIIREIERGGQVYYLHNNIKDINNVFKKLVELIPEAHIVIGHGQMCERDLEVVMNDFYNQRFNVLVCTTIIETGIDISNVNTIIIERADRCGLAQLYQLCGRVGRSNRQAYAYLLIPNTSDISTDAKKRLEVISSLEELGAGFELATHDLEIRGSGELLGEEQSGQIVTIGLSLYMEWLESAVNLLKKNNELSLENLMKNQAEIELHVPILLPEDFLPDANIRLSFYKRIAYSKNIKELEELKIELIDRFGILPDSVYNLLKISKLRQQAQILGIKCIKVNEHSGYIEFYDKNYINFDYLIQLIQNNPKLYRPIGLNKLQFIYNFKNYKIRIKFIEDLLKDFLLHKINIYS